MGKKKSAHKPADQEWELEDSEPVELDRVLVLKKEPLPRKVQLMGAGVKEIRCIWCVRIQPIADAEELDDGWVCGDCLSDMEGTRKYGGLKAKVR